MGILLFRFGDRLRETACQGKTLRREFPLLSKAVKPWLRRLSPVRTAGVEDGQREWPNARAGAARHPSCRRRMETSMKHAAFAGCLVAALAACQPVVPDGPDLASCGANALQGLVGQPASVLETMKFGQQTRIIRPDTAVTMDYRVDRLNIEIDRTERISRVHCS
ncbi:hypothetical protein EYC08_07370 [Tabrizicola sp. WMC-M-20]|nr:hypothetical protein EYC08_07370 [Tabrizicola sp. WMC-M-20]